MCSQWEWGQRLYSLHHPASVFCVSHTSDSIRAVPQSQCPHGGPRHSTAAWGSPKAHSLRDPCWRPNKGKKTLHKLWMHLYLWPYILREMKQPLYTLAAGEPVRTPVCVLHPLCSGVTNAFLPAPSLCQHCLEVSFHWATGTTAPSRLCLLS